MSRIKTNISSWLFFLCIWLTVVLVMPLLVHAALPPRNETTVDDYVKDVSSTINSTGYNDLYSAQMLSQYGNYTSCVRSIFSQKNSETFKQCLDAANNGDYYAGIVVSLMYTTGYGVRKNEDKGLRELNKIADLSNPLAHLILGLFYAIKQPPLYELARPHFQAAYDLGATKASYFLGVIYLNGHGIEKDYEKARKYFEEASSYDVPDALHNFAFMLENGFGGESNITMAIEKYQDAAEKGYVLSMERLGYLYLTGENVTQNYKTAKYWFEKCVASGGATNCQHNLAYMYENGMGGPKDLSKAAVLYSDAALNNDKESQYALGIFYRKGSGVKKDFKEAFHWSTLSAESGFAPAQNSLGNMYYTGEGVEKNYSTAAFWFQKALLQNYHLSKFNLAVMYFNGKVPGKSIDDSITLLKEAAVEGNVHQAQLMLGRIYYDGVGVEKNIQKAKYWFERAAQQENMQAQYNLACIFRDGLLGSPDYSQAMDYFEKAGNQGHLYAQMEIALCYKNGLGTAINLQKAINMLKDLSKKGLHMAQYNLAVMYLHGEGTDVSYKNAFNLMQQAVADDSDKYGPVPEAKFALGNLYSEGKGVEKDDTRASYWYQNAAEDGHREAIAVLGARYLFGAGVEQNVSKGVEYLDKSTKMGDAESPRILGVAYFNGNLLPKDMTKAVRLLKLSAERGDKEAGELLHKINNKKNIESVDLMDLFDKGTKMFHAHELRGAGNIFKKLISYKPDVVDAYIYLGIIYGMQKKYNESIVVLEKANEIAPDNIDVLANLGFAYMQTGQLDFAIHFFNKTLSINPNHRKTLVNLKRVKAKKK